MSRRVAYFGSTTSGVNPLNFKAYYIATGIDGNVSSLADDSGNGNTLTQGVFGSQPTRTSNYINFSTGDFLDNSTANIFSGDSSGYIFFSGIWNGAQEYLFTSSDEGSTSYWLVVRIDTSGKVRVSQRNNDTTDNVTSTNVIVSGSYYYGYVKSDGTSYEINLDGSIETPIVVSGTNSGDWYADTSNRDNLVMGAWIRTSSTYSQPSVKAIWYTSEADGDLNSALYLTTLAGLE